MGKKLKLPCYYGGGEEESEGEEAEEMKKEEKKRRRRRRKKRRGGEEKKEEERKKRVRWEQQVWSKDAEQASSCAVRVKAPLRPPLCSAEAGSSLPGLSQEQPEPSSGRPVSLLQLRAGRLGAKGNGAVAACPLEAVEVVHPPGDGGFTCCPGDCVLGSRAGELGHDGAAWAMRSPGAHPGSVHVGGGYKAYGKSRRVAEGLPWQRPGVKPPREEQQRFSFLSLGRRTGCG